MEKKMEKNLTEQSVDQLNHGEGRLAYADEHIGGLDIPTVTWWKDPGLRRLYIMMPVLFLGSTINGYDGSLLNGLQTMQPWQECKFAASSRLTSIS